MGRLISPSKPIMTKDLYCPIYIKLNRNQVDFCNIKQRAKYEGFREQTDRHITIIGATSQKKIKKALSKFTIEKQKKLIKEIKNLLKGLKWQYKQEPKIYLISEKKCFNKDGNIIEHRKAYIRPIKMPDMKTFYTKLNILLQSRIPVQFPHITLFTKGERPNPDYYGIGISSKTNFKRLHPKYIKDEN